MRQSEPISGKQTALSFDLQADGSTLTLHLRGDAEMDSLDALAGYLETAHREALRRGATMVVCDMRELAFLNSASFKQLITWITNAGGAEPPYRITFVGNRDLAWQRRSLVALRCVDERTVLLEGIEIEPEPG